MSEEELNKDKQELLIIAASTTGTRLTPYGAKHFLQIIKELKKKQKENEELKCSLTKASKIIDEYSNEIENDTKKIIEYQDKWLEKW